MRQSDDLAGSASFPADSPIYTLALDISIVISCLLAIACRIKLLANERTPSNSASTAAAHGSCCTHREANGTAGHVGNFADSSVTSVALQGGGGVVGRNVASSVTANEGAETNAFCLFSDCVSYREGPDDSLGHLFGLSISVFGATALVNYLSLVSNCLTRYMRPSQVLYAYLLSFCDLLLFIMSERAGKGVGNRRSAERVACGALRDGVPKTKPLSAAVVHETHDLDTVGATVMSRVDVHKYRSGTDVNGPTCAHSRAATEVATDLSTHEDERWSRRPSSAALPGGVLSKLKSSVWCALGNPCWRWYVFPILHITSVVLLIILERYRLFFSLGTVAGYVASCVTLHKVGYGFSAFLAALLASTDDKHCGPVHLLMGGDRVEVLMGFCSLSHVRFAGRASVYYVLQQVFSGVCVVLYVLMLLQEDEGLYSTHVSVMRWYVNPCGQGLLDAQRMFTCLLVVRGARCRKACGKLFPLRGARHESYLL